MMMMTMMVFLIMVSFWCKKRNMRFWILPSVDNDDDGDGIKDEDEDHDGDGLSNKSIKECFFTT